MKARVVTPPMVALVVLAAALVAYPALLPGRAAGASHPVVGLLPFVDHDGQACVIDVERVNALVSCTEPGLRGFRIVGLTRGPEGEYATIADVGDVNGDGIDDFAIGEPWATFDGRKGAGVTYVVFGSRQPTTIDLAHLGAGGFQIGGAAAGNGTALFDPGQYGASLTPGDANGDGLDDVLVGAEGTDNRAGSGPAYVVFGKRDSAPVDLAHLGSGGFAIEALPGRYGSPGPLSFIGDVNGDGLDDIGVYGPAAVVFGRAGSAPVDLDALGTGGFRIDGLNPNSDHSIVGVGDVNGDGIDDFAVGDWDAGPGRAYVIYGRRTPHDVDLSRVGTRGFVIAHSAAPELSVSITGVSGPGGQTELALSDERNVYVVGLHARTSAIDLRRPGFGCVIAYPHDSAAASHSEPVAPLVVSGGAGDLVVEFYIYRRSAYRVFVVFAHPSQEPIDAGHLGAQGFAVVGTS